MREKVGLPVYTLCFAICLFWQGFVLMIAIGIAYSNGLVGTTIDYWEAVLGGLIVDALVSPSIGLKQMKP